jgi:hypothetical protein
MPIDPSIIAGIKPIQIQDPLESYGKSLTLQTLMQKGQMQDQEIQDQQAYRQAFKDAGGDSAKLGQNLMNAGLGKQYGEFQKTQFEAQKAQSGIAKDKAETSKIDYETQIGKLSHGAALLGNAVDQPSWEQAVRTGVMSGIITPDFASKLPQQYDPQVVKQLQDGALTQVQKLADQRARESQDIIKRGQDMTQATAFRGQDKVDARAKDTLEQGKVPAGYKKVDGGNLQAIPGGPADLKIQGQFNQDTAALTNSTASMDRLATAANEALNHPGLPGTAGFRGVIPNAPGSDAANAAALMNTLKSQVAFGVLQDMRNNSKTGGALGAVSDKEGQLLQSNLAALDKSQSAEALKANLQKIIDYTAGAKERLAQAYNLKHGGQVPTNAAPTTPSAPSQQDIDAELRRRGVAR